ncbi:MAG: P1 family peptidase [Phyllobacteriaceae bacterium]|nr:P1 family peptidase [Phyllobacteriaceae bacterium]
MNDKSTSRRPGPRNLITDVAGLRVGNAHDEMVRSGVTAVLCDPPAVAAVQVLGGAPGTRETDLLEPHNMVETVHAIVLAGGSAFGLDAASGVQAVLRDRGQGVIVHGHVVPIVPAAILFDLANGGDKAWGDNPPYRALGIEAALAADEEFALGTEGAGHGALTAGLKGGIGSASECVDDFIVGALVAANPVGGATMGRGRHFWAAPFEIGAEFGGLGLPARLPADAAELKLKFRELSPGGNTTIGVIATDADLTKAEAKRLAIAAHDGYARAIWPSHTPLDGDLVFALATGASGRRPDAAGFVALCAAAASAMARAVARGVFEATRRDGDLFPAWRDTAS